MGLAEVSTILWQERHLLELLQFKLEVQQLLLANGRGRWLNLAGDEVERVLDELRHVELARAVEVDGVARELGLSPNPSLAELALSAADPWGGIFDQHRAALLGLSEEIRALSSVNRDLLVRGEEAIRLMAGSLDDPASEHYLADGTKTSSRPVNPFLVDQVL